MTDNKIGTIKWLMRYTTIYSLIKTHDPFRTSNANYFLFIYATGSIVCKIACQCAEASPYHLICNLKNLSIACNSSREIRD